MIAASGTIRIPTRHRPLHAISQFDKNSGLNPGCKHNKDNRSSYSQTRRRGKRLPTTACPARQRKRTVPGLRGVAVSSQMNPVPAPGWPAPSSAYSAVPAGTRGPARGPRRDLAAVGDRTGPAFRPPGTTPPIYLNQTPKAIRHFPPAFLNSPRPPRSGTGHAIPRAWALVTSPQDLLITVRAVITTVRLRSGAA